MNNKGGTQKIKTGTIFRLEGDNLWGYDIQLFNYFNEKEIILEPERKYIVDDILCVNDIDIVYIHCKMKKAPLILENIKSTKNNNQINYETNHFIKENRKRYNMRRDNEGNKNDNYIKNNYPCKIIDNDLNIITHDNLKKPNLQISKSKWKREEEQEKDILSSNKRNLSNSVSVNSRLNLINLYDTNRNKINNFSKENSTINLNRNSTKPNINFKKGSMKKPKEKDIDEEVRNVRYKLIFRDGEKIKENIYENNEDKKSIHSYKNFGFKNEEEYEIHKAREKSLFEF